MVEVMTNAVEVTHGGEATAGEKQGSMSPADPPRNPNVETVAGEDYYVRSGGDRLLAGILRTLGEIKDRLDGLPSVIADAIAERQLDSPQKKKIKRGR